MIWPFSTIASLRSQLAVAQDYLWGADARNTRRLSEIAMLQRTLAETETALSAAKAVAVPKKVATPTKTTVVLTKATPTKATPTKTTVVLTKATPATTTVVTGSALPNVGKLKKDKAVG